MSRFSLLVLAILTGCSSSPRAEPDKPWEPPTYVTDSGANLIVIEARNDFLDDFSMGPFQIAPGEADPNPVGPRPSTGTQWLGEQALNTITRAVFELGRDFGSVTSHCDWNLSSNQEAKLTLPAGESSGFRLKLKASRSKHPAYADVSWETEFLSGYWVEVMRYGAPPIEHVQSVERIAGGTCRLPWRASLFMHRFMEGERILVLIVRLNSVRD